MKAIEAIVRAVSLGELHYRILPLASTAWGLADRLPTTCTEAHEPTIAMVDIGRLIVHVGFQTNAISAEIASSVYMAMEEKRARVEGAK